MNTQAIIKDGIELGKASRKENAPKLFGRKAVRIIVASKMAQYGVNSVESFSSAIDIYVAA